MNLPTSNGRSIIPSLIISLFFIIFFQSISTAAPHITKTRPGPHEKPGRTLLQRLGRKIPKAAAPSLAYPASVSILFLRVEFQKENPDDMETTGNGLWSDPVYAHEGDPDYWVNKAQTDFINYWREVSYGLLTINITATPKVYALSHPMAYYGNETDASLQTLIYDSVTAASLDGVDFSLYDAVLIVHAGAGEEADLGDTPEDLWSLYYSSSVDSGGNGCIQSRENAGQQCLAATLKDGKRISEAIVMPQTDSQDDLIVDPLGVYVHEFGHWLGLPDLYCTSTYPPCSLDGAGNWSLMGDGVYNADPALCPGYYSDPAPADCVFGSSPAHPDAWSMLELGWVMPQTFATYPDPGATVLNPIVNLNIQPFPAAGTDLIKLPASTSTPATTHQYFLLENRQLVGFDKGLPGPGLLVWLVDEDVINANLASNSVNNSRARPGVKLIEADGDNALLAYGGDTGSDGDPFPGMTGNHRVTPMTNPSSIPYSAYGWVNLRNITQSVLSLPATTVITMDIGFAPQPPQDLDIDRGTGTLSWTGSEAPDLGSYVIYKNGNSVPYATVDAALDAYTDPVASSTADTYLVIAVDINGNESAPAYIGPTLTVGDILMIFSDSVREKALTITNTGKADLHISAMNMSGPDASAFGYRSGCPGAIVPNASCALTITLKAGSAGTKTAFLSINSDDPVSTTTTVMLTGTLAAAAGVGGGGGRCFIATAAYGSPLDPHVDALRKFRDRYLLTTAAGRAFVAFYYRHSPPAAAFIGRHERIRTATRWALTPAVYGIEHPGTSLLFFSSGLLTAIGLHTAMRKRRDRLKNPS